VSALKVNKFWDTKYAFLLVVDLLMVVIGCIVLAGYEKRNLSKELEKEYWEHRQKTPLCFPVRCPSEEFIIPSSLITPIFVYILS